MRRIIIIQLLLCISLIAMAQVKAGDVIHGKVTDEKGNPLEATVAEFSIKRIIKATQTDANGDYSLEIVNPKDTLLVGHFKQSPLTYGSKRVPITSSTINIVLELKQSSAQQPPKENNASSAPTPLPASKDSYDDYKQMVMDYYGLRLSFPEKMVDSTVFPKDKAGIYSSCFFTFADTRESNPYVGYPGGLFLQLEEDCYVVMEAHSLREKPRPGQFHSIDENTVKLYEPHFDSCMLNNCGLPWFHVDHDPSVLNNQELMKQIEDARSKYILCKENSKLQKQTNSDRVCIVRLPYIDKIYCGRPDSTQIAEGRHSKNETLNKVWNECSLCYGVDFYRADRYIPFTMLVFTNSKRGKPIEKYVEQLARYIYFDPNFKY